MVRGSRIIALGLSIAHLRVATAISASCSWVVPTGAGAAAVGMAALAVGDEGDVDEAGLDGGGGVLDVDDEGGAADGGAVRVFRTDAQVFGDLEAGRPAGPGGEDAVHLRHVQDRQS